jgi:predicted dehydrogenase
MRGLVSSAGMEAATPGADTRLRVGLIGVGYWGPNLLRVLIEMETVEVTYICDVDPERLDRYARRYPSTVATTRVDDLLEEERLEAVIIATPVHSHFGLALRALEAGKHVFVEKPLASSSSEAEELERAATERKLGLMCGHTFLYSPPVRAVKDLIDRGELGDLFFVTSSRVNLGLHQRDVSVVWDLGPHDFSILLYWLNETPESVSAVGRDAIVDGIPDVVFINLSFPSGVLANVELSWLAPSKLRRTAVVGSNKMVVYDDVSPEPIKVYDHGVIYTDPESFGQYQLSYRTGDILSPKLDTAEPIALQLEDFVESVRTGRRPVADTEIACKVVRIVEAAEASMEQGGVPVSVGGLRIGS